MRLLQVRQVISDSYVASGYSNLPSAVRMNHVNMIKQSDPAQCLAESEEIIRMLPENAMREKVSLYYGMAAACEQLVKGNGDLEYAKQDHDS